MVLIDGMQRIAPVGARRVVDLELADEVGDAGHVEIGAELAGLDAPAQDAGHQLAVRLHAVGAAVAVIAI